jgi:hypothetical protein
MRSRPMGVTILAVLLALNAVFYAVIAAVALFNREALRSMLHMLSPSGMGPESMHLAMGGMLPLYYALMAGATAVLAAGFWKLWNWARVVVLALIGFSFLAMVVELRMLFATPTTSALAMTAFRLGLMALCGWYLLYGPVRDAFHHR